MKILVISDDVLVNTIPGREVLRVPTEEGLLTFLSESPDIIFCSAEVGVGTSSEKYAKQSEVLKDIRQSLTPNQRHIRVGFTLGGPDELLRLPFGREELIVFLE